MKESKYGKDQDSNYTINKLFVLQFLFSLPPSFGLSHKLIYQPMVNSFEECSGNIFQLLLGFVKYRRNTGAKQKANFKTGFCFNMDNFDSIVGHRSE